MKHYLKEILEAYHKIVNFSSDSIIGNHHSVEKVQSTNLEPIDISQDASMQVRKKHAN